MSNCSYVNTFRSSVQGFRGSGVQGLRNQKQPMPGSGGDRFPRERLPAVLALTPHLVLVEVERAQRMAGLACWQNHARVVPLADVEQLAPRRVFPGVEPVEAIEADPHHRGAVAVHRHGPLVEQELEREPVANRMVESRAM